MASVNDEVMKVAVKERDAQKSYWMDHSEDLTVEDMMLDSRAADLDRDERPEVLSLLPEYEEGKSVLELGAGIGRFTGELAKTAGKIVALDFIESAIKKNESINGHFKNASFMCADVTSLELKFEDESVDLIFSNWLLMYLSDDEVNDLAVRMLRWLKVGGFIFFRESCFHQSGDLEGKACPAHFRDPRFYTKVFKELHLEDGCKAAKLSLVTFKCIRAYVKNKKTQNQICWLWQKVSSPSDRDFQRFLDNVLFKNTGILCYERVFGQGFVSTGGIETTREFAKKLDLNPGQKVLDVGCGIGGSDFYMAENFDVDVLGIDLSINMLSFALERAIGRKCSVEFEVADCTKKNYPENTFDVIYSRDSILYMQDKPSLFQSFYEWLKPGGKVLITDYCISDGPLSEDFKEYIEQRRFDLYDVKAYGQMLEGAGFDVTAEDITHLFLEVVKRELAAVEKDKQNFVRDFSEEDYDYIINDWKAKIKRGSAGEHRWGLFIAHKK